MKLACELYSHRQKSVLNIVYIIKEKKREIYLVDKDFKDLDIIQGRAGYKD